jgi:carbon monoxide dehydrogenase subunit G
MNFAGSERFDCSPDTLWARLTDMAFVSRVIPDVERVDRLGEFGFACHVRPRFTFLSGSLDLSFEVLEPVPSRRLKVRSQGKGIGASVVVESELHLAGSDSGTELQWTGKIVAREGLLKPVSPALIQAAARRVIDSFWQRFREALASDCQAQPGSK